MAEFDISQFEVASAYHQPRHVRVDGTMMEPAAADGLSLAARLEDGDTSSIPDGVRDWLAFHTMGVDSRGVGTMRNIVAEQLNGPHDDPDLPRRLGALIRLTVRKGNEFAADMALTEIGAQFIVDQMGGEIAGDDE
ncbi:MAG TPA: hypothetical protein VLH86_00490 [Patescibacteria group bacterium]|nr:hypothetical protein [Patescibacteria group bacterium]